MLKFTKLLPRYDTASRDPNRVTTLLGVSSINFSTPTLVAVNPATGAMLTQVNDQGKTILTISGSAASSGDNTLLAADASNKIKVFAYSFSTTSTTEVLLKLTDGAAGTELWRVDFQAPTSIATGANLAVSPPAWILNTSLNKALILNLSAAQTIHYSIAYFKEAS